MIKIKANICVPKVDKRLPKPGSYKNPKNLCFCLSVLFMYFRRKASAVKIGDGVVFISSKSQKRESQMMASIRDRLCISYDQKNVFSVTSHFPTCQAALRGKQAKMT